jgi:hypothetical protein
MGAASISSSPVVLVEAVAARGSAISAWGRELAGLATVSDTFSSLLEEMFDSQVCSGDRGIRDCERELRGALR